MKKFIAIAAAALIAISVLGCDSKEVEPERRDQLTLTHYYENVAIVTEVNKQWVTADCEMGNGEIHSWCFTGNGYEVGDLVTLTFDDNGTEGFDDDICYAYKLTSL